jgi:hypothetical protein
MLLHSFFRALSTIEYKFNQLVHTTHITSHIAQVKFKHSYIKYGSTKCFGLVGINPGETTFEDVVLTQLTHTTPHTYTVQARFKHSY